MRNFYRLRNLDTSFPNGKHFLWCIYSERCILIHSLVSFSFLKFILSVTFDFSDLHRDWSSIWDTQYLEWWPGGTPREVLGSGSSSTGLNMDRLCVVEMREDSRTVGDTWRTEDHCLEPRACANEPLLWCLSMPALGNQGSLGTVWAGRLHKAMGAESQPLPLQPFRKDLPRSPGGMGYNTTSCGSNRHHCWPFRNCRLSWNLCETKWLNCFFKCGW